jgi:hypothetical protein
MVVVVLMAVGNVKTIIPTYLAIENELQNINVTIVQNHPQMFKDEVWI